MSLKPAVSSSARLLDCRRLASEKVRLARPLLLRQLKERLLEEVLLAADVFGNGVGAVVAAAEPRPLFRTEASPAIASVRIGPCQQK